MNILSAGKLATRFNLRYTVAESIIREAMTTQRRRWMLLTYISLAFTTAGVLAPMFSDAPRSLVAKLPFLASLIVLLAQQWLIRRAARKVILVHAKQAAPQNN